MKRDWPGPSNFADNNAVFNSKVNATATLLRMFAAHNERVKVSDARLPDAQMDLFRSYQQRRLDLDEAAWWWPSEFVREAGALDLLSPDEMRELQRLVDEYNKSVLNTMNQLTTLWQFLDSSEYRLDELSEQKRKKIDADVGREMGNDYVARNKLVSSVAALLSKSRYRTSTFDLLGL